MAFTICGVLCLIAAGIVIAIGASKGDSVRA